ncbi:MAG: helix-turn-helix domain-containing protein [Candidatus Adiutrix sp.]
MSIFPFSKSGINWSTSASPELVNAYANRLISRRKRLGLSQRDLAKMVDVSVNTIQSYESGSLPRGEHFLNLARSLQCSLDWLIGLNTGALSWPTAVDDDDHISVHSTAPSWEAPRSWVFPPYLEGAEGESLGARNQAPVSFERKWLSNLVPDVNNARLLQAKGPAMQPTFADGDLLLINVGQCQIYQGQAYAIKLDGCLLVNRVEIRPGGIYRIVSDNREIAPPYEIDSKQMDVLGQVVWSGRLSR